MLDVEIRPKWTPELFIPQWWGVMYFQDTALLRMPVASTNEESAHALGEQGVRADLVAALGPVVDDRGERRAAERAGWHERGARRVAAKRSRRRSSG